MYVHCYCLNKSIIFSVNFDSECSAWRDQYSVYLSIPIVFALAILVANEIVSAIYRKLSAFEAHEYLTSELYSYIIKKTILVTTDLALIIIILSLNVRSSESTTNDNNFLTVGQFSDLSADWYRDVGIIITVNMFFNIFAPII